MPSEMARTADVALSPVQRPSPRTVRGNIGRALAAPSLRQAVAAAVVILLAAVIAEAMRPRTLMADLRPKVEFESVFPKVFGTWKLRPEIRLVTPADLETLADKIYSQTLARGYMNDKGQTVMLLVAYGPRQTDRLQLHRPEICYVAEGFDIVRNAPGTIRLAESGRPVPVRQMLARRGQRVENVTYWMRIGDEIESSVIGRQRLKFLYGLKGTIPDGILVRVSSVGLETQEAEQLHEQFFRDLIMALPEAARDGLISNEFLAPPAVRTQR
ncbi:hypothetical protein ES708_03225 [subsurface metagenome]